jgi:hypothetical protein
MSSNAEYDPKMENRAAFRLALYVFWFVLISSLMLAINTWMIFALSQGTAKLLPNFEGIAFALQALIFIGPMVLLYLEWFAWDVVFAQLSRRRSARRS